jgi:hypothetical protein
MGILTGVKVSKIIDLVPRLKTVNQDTAQSANNAEVVDLHDKKQTILFHERRQVKRTILTELISSMVILPEKGLMKVSIHDISDEGISFELDSIHGHFKVGEEISLRVYLNQKAYFPIQVTIKHVTPVPEEGVVRHGTVYLKNEENNVALQHFVKFVESASQGLKKDSGDMMVTRIS